MTKLSELTGDYLLDSADSRIGFVVPMVLLSKVRGQFDDFEGTARLDGDDPSKSSVQVTIQAKSIQTRNQRAGGFFVGADVTLELAVAAVRSTG